MLVNPLSLNSFHRREIEHMLNSSTGRHHLEGFRNNGVKYPPNNCCHTFNVVRHDHPAVGEDRKETRVRRDIALASQYKIRMSRCRTLFTKTTVP